MTVKPTFPLWGSRPYRPFVSPPRRDPEHEARVDSRRRSRFDRWFRGHGGTARVTIADAPRHIREKK